MMRAAAIAIVAVCAVAASIVAASIRAAARDDDELDKIAARWTAEALRRDQVTDQAETRKRYYR